MLFRKAVVRHFEACFQQNRTTTQGREPSYVGAKYNAAGQRLLVGDGGRKLCQIPTASRSADCRRADRARGCANKNGLQRMNLRSRVTMHVRSERVVSALPPSPGWISNPWWPAKALPRLRDADLKLVGYQRYVRASILARSCATAEIQAPAYAGGTCVVSDCIAEGLTHASNPYPNPAAGFACLARQVFERIGSTGSSGHQRDRARPSWLCELLAWRNVHPARIAAEQHVWRCSAGGYEIADSAP